MMMKTSIITMLTLVTLISTAYSQATKQPPKSKVAANYPKGETKSVSENKANAPENQKHIQDYLSAFCFGDFYTRNGLDIKTRELLTLSMVSSLGGADSQVKSHVQANKNVGNDKATLIGVITQCLLYMGFPRTLNALAYVNEIYTEN